MHDLVVVSDFHLGRGKNDHTGRYHELEAFFYDDDFRSFCQWLIDDAHKRNAKLRLVLEQVTANSPEFRKQRLLRGSAFSERNARHIARLQERGLADADIDPTAAAQALSGMVSRMAYQAFALGDGADIDQLVFTATRLWANAIGMHRPDAPTG